MCCEEADYSTSTPLLSYRSLLITVSLPLWFIWQNRGRESVGRMLWMDQQWAERVGFLSCFLSGVMSAFGVVFPVFSFQVHGQVWSSKKVLIIHFCYLRFYFPIRQDVFTNPTRRYLWHLNFWSFPHAFPFFIIIYYWWTVATEVGTQRRTESVGVAGIQSAWLTENLDEIWKCFHALLKWKSFWFV